MTQTPFRPSPALPAHAYSTYSLTRPRATHYRTASCAEVECAAHLRGWSTTVLTSTVLGAKQANYIRLHSGRRFEVVTEFGDMVVFRFPAGQKCFTEHQLPIEREPLYIVRGGDHRGNPTGEQRLHVRAADWVDDFATNQQSLADKIAKG